MGVRQLSLGAVMCWTGLFVFEIILFSIGHASVAGLFGVIHHRSGRC